MDEAGVGKVFATGWGFSGQLGIKPPSTSQTPQNRSTPLLVDYAAEGRAIVALACGSRTTLALNASGQVYSWGKGEDGQLGHGAHSNEYVPRLIEDLACVQIEQIACRGSHACAVDSTGRLWAWGSNREGQLGLGTRGDGQSRPEVVKGLGDELVALCACGKEFTVVATVSGRCYSWGQGEDGQLGSGGIQPCPQPQRVLGLSTKRKIRQIVAGSRHTLVRHENGAVYAWGWNKNGQIGVGTTGTVWVPALVQRNGFQKVAAGYRHSAAIGERSEVYLWGSNQYGQLGHGGLGDEARPRLLLLDRDEPSPLSLDSTVSPQALLSGNGQEMRAVTIACGGGHTVIVDWDGVTWTVGRNDDGQLGVGDIQMRTSPSRMLVPSGRLVSQACCGWAHTVLLTAPPVRKGDVSPRMNLLGFADRFSISAGGKQLPKSFAKGDWDAFFSQFMNVILQVMVIRQLATAFMGNSNEAAEIVLAGMLPGYAVMLLISHVLLFVQARRAMEDGREHTAQPHGINSMLLFAYLQLIIGHTFEKTSDPQKAYGAGLFCAIASGLAQLLMVPMANFLKRSIPSPALFAALAGTAISFLTLQFTFQMFERPFTSIPPFLIVLLAFTAEVRFPFGMPGGAIAVLFGAALAWVLSILPFELQAPPPAVTPDPIGLVVPFPQFPALLAGYSAGIEALPTALPLAMLNFISNLATVESAQAAGDTYDISGTLIIDSLATIIGALFGCPFPGAIFIGQPAYKKMGARCGYLVLNFSFTAVIACFQLTSLFLQLVPLESVVTMLLWVGIVITAQSFQSTPRGSAAAVVVGIIPGVSAWTLTEICNVLNGSPLTLEQVVDQRPDLFLRGLLALRMGYILVAVVLAAVYHHVEERRFATAAIWALLGAVFSAFGLIHTFELAGNTVSAKMGLFVDQVSVCFFVTYTLAGLMLFVAAWSSDTDDKGLDAVAAFFDSQLCLNASERVPNLSSFDLSPPPTPPLTRSHSETSIAGTSNTREPDFLQKLDARG